MRRQLIAVIAIGFCLAAAPAAEAQPSEALQLAKRYVELSRTSDQLAAANDTGAESLVQMFRQANAAASEAVVARLRALIIEESTKTAAKITDMIARRLAERLSVEDLRAVVQAMESEPAVGRLTAAMVSIQPDLVRLSTQESMAVMARAMQRLRQEKPS